MRRLWQYSGLMGLMALAAVCTAPSAQAEPLALRYLIGWGHMTLAEAEISYSQSDERYFLAAAGRTRGLLDLLFSWQGHTETEGSFAGGGRQPLLHEHEGTWEEESRWTRVRWTNEAPLTEAMPAPDPKITTPVPAASVSGTEDPFTAILSLLDQLATTGRCEGAAMIWDGRRRYDVSVTHLGEERMLADRPWAYEGPTLRCSIGFERIGGFRREAPDWRSEEEGGLEERTIWVAEVAPDRWVLVRAEIETQYGTVVGRLWSRS